MRRPRYILRYFHVPTLSWMGHRCYFELGRAVDDYVKLATRSRDSVSCVEIYDFGADPVQPVYSPEHVLFVDEWSDDLRQQIANATRHKVERGLAAFFSVGGAS